MSEEWKKPPPKLVKGRRKFPRYFIYLIIGLYLCGVISTWAVAGRWFPIELILILWLFPIVFISIVFALTWWIIG